MVDSESSPSDVDDTDGYELAAQWQDWVIENALEGAHIEDMVATIVEAGAAADIVENEVLRLCTSAGFRAAQYWRRRALRLAKVQSLRTAYHRGHGPKRIERRAGLTADALRARYLRFAEPVVLTDVVNAWPAVERWTDAELINRLGKTPVQACVGRTAHPNPDRDIERFYQTLAFDELVGRMDDAAGTNDVYLVGNNKFFENDASATLLDDIDHRIASYLDDAGVSRAHMSFWYGPAGTLTNLHHDPASVLYAQVRGRKRFRMLSPNNTPALLSATLTYAAIAPEDAAREAGDRLYEVTLCPGELLLLPAGWWHEVCALESSVSIGFTNIAGPTGFSWYQPGTLGDEQVTRRAAPAQSAADGDD